MLRLAHLGKVLRLVKCARQLIKTLKDPFPPVWIAHLSFTYLFTDLFIYLFINLFINFFVVRLFISKEVVCKETVSNTKLDNPLFK